MTVKTILIILGAHNLNVREPEQMRQIVTKKHLILHPNADAALVETVTPIEYTAAIQPIALPQLFEIHKDYVGQSATASGWGENC
jgi:hypothetical protein